ncbi:MAG TPA: YbaK/EbsC family protein [Candidatus Limnocylindrales bacterium]|nr:YbaK/EbsC family protein [Candidatus Limnocylindrales bacterium]
MSDQLRAKGVHFEELFHQPTFHATDEAHRLGLPVPDVIKTIAIKTGSGVALAGIPACCRLDLQRVREVTGDHHARLATEAEIQHDFPGYELGALPPFGRTLKRALYVDPLVMEHDEIVFAASPTQSLRIHTADLLRDEDALIVSMVGA